MNKKNMEEIIKIDESSFAIITKANYQSKDCDCDDSGEPIITFHNSDIVMKQCDYTALSDIEREKLNVSGGSATCSKCGIPYWDRVNPYYLED